MSIALVVSRYHAFITDALEAGARTRLREAGVAGADIVTFGVPGAFEIPQAAAKIAGAGGWDAVVCLGCLIRGETPHFDYIAQAVAHGLTRAAQDTGVPMAFGVLTTNTAEEALARAGDGPANKGREAASAALDMTALYATIRAGASAEGGLAATAAAAPDRGVQVSVTSRHQAREAALQILYFWQVGGTQPSAAIGAYFREHQPEASEETRLFAESLVYGTIGHVADLDKLIEQHSKNWRLERIAIVDRLVLRLAAFELQHEPETPAPVVMNEALELARTFSGDESVPFVNGVLDAMRKTIGRSGDANDDVE